MTWPSRFSWWCYQKGPLIFFSWVHVERKLKMKNILKRQNFLNCRYLNLLSRSVNTSIISIFLPFHNLQTPSLSIYLSSPSILIMLGMITTWAPNCLLYSLFLAEQHTHIHTGYLLRSRLSSFKPFPNLLINQELSKKPFNKISSALTWELPTKKSHYLIFQFIIFQSWLFFLQTLFEIYVQWYQKSRARRRGIAKLQKNQHITCWNRKFCGSEEKGKEKATGDLGRNVILSTGESVYTYVR